MLWQYLLLFVIVIAAFPIGVLLAKSCKEELKAGKPAFIAILIISFAALFYALASKLDTKSKLITATSLLFLAIIAAVPLSTKEIKRRKRSN